MNLQERILKRLEEAHIEKHETPGGGSMEIVRGDTSKRAYLKGHKRPARVSQVTVKSAKGKTLQRTHGITPATGVKPKARIKYREGEGRSEERVKRASPRKRK